MANNRSIPKKGHPMPKRCTSMAKKARPMLNQSAAMANYGSMPKKGHTMPKRCISMAKKARPMPNQMHSLTI